MKTGKSKDDLLTFFNSCKSMEICLRILGGLNFSHRNLE